MNRKTLAFDKSYIGTVRHFLKPLCWAGLFACFTANAQQAPQGQIDEYRDTEFGEHLYSEASVATRLELLRLLSKDTPSIMVFMHAISMGLGIEDMLEAAVQYEPEKARDFAESAISLLPLLSDSQDYTYSQYELEDLERSNSSEPYPVQEVITRFFDDREILGPQPDWIEGQYHFDASVGQLKELIDSGETARWYFQHDNTDLNRPIFIALYEGNKSVLVDGADRIRQMPTETTLPVVFIFNRERERSIDYLVETSEYLRTIKGVQQAYSEYSHMVTPVPDWQLGEYHLQAELVEIAELFNLPEEDDFESAEHWQELLQQAREYEATQPSFLVVVLSGDENNLARSNLSSNAQYAAYEDPREEQAFPFVHPNNDQGDDDSSVSDGLTMRTIMSEGLIINRPDLLAAIKAVGNLDTVPISFYYIDNSRTKPYTLGPRALRLFVNGIQPPGVPGGGGGGFGPPPVCASPPCSQ